MDEQMKSSTTSTGGWRESVALALKKNAEDMAKRPPHLRYSREESIAAWNANAKLRRELGLP